MVKVYVRNFAISLDGYAAGPNQSLDLPFGEEAIHLHDWSLATRTARQMFGMEGGEEGLDDDFTTAGDAGIGATIMGRNMFGPLRGPWANYDWNGWWGDEPPYHHPTFILTHYSRPPVTMQGGTTFHFIDAGIEAALERASEAAGGKDVRIGGGASTIRQYLESGLIDELHLAIVPILLGRGERLFEDLANIPSMYECVEHVCSPAVMHIRLARCR